METLLHNLSEVFAVSIIHSLWQCLLIYLVLRVLLADIVRFSAASKYNITVAALFASTAWFVYTLFNQAGHYSWQFTTQPAVYGYEHLPLINTLKQIAHADERYELTIERYLPYISIIYVTGLLFHSLRLTSAWIQMQQLKKETAADGKLQNSLKGLAGLLSIERTVMVSYAQRVDIPCITGYLKPIILLPLSLGSYLSATEVEAILLHELAHVKRNDYIINLLQQVVSVLLFFNPFIMLMNRIINQERENSCDDMVVAVTQQPLVYAQALLKIEQNNVRQLPLALAATNNKYQLLNRIERIMKTKKQITNIRHLVLAFTILAGSITSIAWLNPAIGNGKLTVKKVHSADLLDLMSDSTRKTAPKVTRTSATHKNQGSNRVTRGNKVWIDDNGDHYYYTEGMHDPKLEAMGKQMEIYGKQIEKYYNGPEFKKMSEDMELKGKAVEQYYGNADFKKLSEQMEQQSKVMEQYYNNPEFKKMSEDVELKGKAVENFYANPEIKKLQAEQENISREYESAYGNNTKGEKIGKEMEMMGKKVETYFNSPAFKEENARLEKKYGIPHNYSYNETESENHKKYKAELKKFIPADINATTEKMGKLGEEMRAFYNSPERKEKTERMHTMGDSLRRAFDNPQIKEQQEQMRKLGEQMRQYSNSPEMKLLQEQMRKKGEEMRKYTNNPKMKQQQEEMRKLGERMREYTNNPEMKHLQEQMHQLGEQMREYTNTPEFKRRLEEWKKTSKAYNWNDRDNVKAPLNMNAPEPEAIPAPPDVRLLPPPPPAEQPAPAPVKP